eukprot:TRINITY_DN10890_c0_g1_i1.p1 TRINITY_DN10890_c0_g1~~TRINITY_DN10890_c0_g1_i1.p1  ORF type:complete len:365 (+),score=121.42 TRINITY_DN10890_c0_g1_i1:63-1097(+)
MATQSDLLKRKRKMMRTRLEQHSGAAGGWVPKHAPSRGVAGDQQSKINEAETVAAEAEQESNVGVEASDEESDFELDEDEEEEKVTKSKEQLREEWREEQLELREKLDLTDAFDFAWPGSESKSTAPLKYIAGMDVSFIQGTDHAVTSLTVFEYPSLELVYEGFTHCFCRYPYIAGFLAYRELPGLLQAITDLKRRRPELMPQVIFMDGNGTIHHHGFGIACHFGVLTGIPTLGIAKNLLCVDGMSHDQVEMRLEDKEVGDDVELWGNSGRVWGHAYKTSKDKAIYVSPGHRMSLPSALGLVRAVWEAEVHQKYLPMPTRLANHLSRTYIKKIEKKAKASGGRR